MRSQITVKEIGVLIALGFLIKGLSVFWVPFVIVILRIIRWIF